MISPTVPSNNNDYYYPYTHHPHTHPDPQVNAEPNLYSRQQHQYVLPPHSPHTTTPSTNSPALSQYHSSAYSAPSIHAPHTAPAQFTSMNPSPQVGDVQLDFIPLPTALPSAPSQNDTVPNADEEVKYEASTSALHSSPSYQHPSTPSPFPEYANGHYTGYRDQQQHQQPYVLPPPTSPFPIPPASQQASYDNVTFVEATPIDMNDGKYKLSSTAGGSSTFLQNLRNPRKKIFWIFLFSGLAIIFGILGATVWRSDGSDKKADKPNSSGNQGTTTSTYSTGATGPAPSNSAVLTPAGPPVLTPVVVPTPVTVSTGPAPPPTVTNPASPDRPTTTRDPPSPPTSQPTTPSGGKDEYFRCRGLCNSAWNSCYDNCKSSDSTYKSCVASCNGDFSCEANCRFRNACLGNCDATLNKCNDACPQYTP